MLIKILGIVFMIVGGGTALWTLFPLIGSIFGLLGLTLKLAVSLVFLYVGHRLFSQD